MTRAEIVAHNRGVAVVASLAAAAANALAARLVDKPTRFAFAIEALDAIVEASADVMVPMPPDTSTSVLCEWCFGTTHASTVREENVGDVETSPIEIGGTG